MSNMTHVNSHQLLGTPICTAVNKQEAIPSGDGTDETVPSLRESLQKYPCQVAILIIKCASLYNEVHLLSIYVRR